jgi:hypothetical protein
LNQIVDLHIPKFSTDAPQQAVEFRNQIASR